MIYASRSHSTSFLKNISFKLFQEALVIALILGLQANIAFAQQLDTSSPEAQTAARQIEQPSAQTLPQPSSHDSSTFTLPVGTRLPIGLLRPLSINKTKPGDTVYLQVTFPVSVGTQMLIPPGTYLHGTIGKIVRRDHTRAQLEFELSSASLIYSTGYTVNVTGAYDVVPTIAGLTPPDIASPQSSLPAGVMTATGTTTPPTLPTPSLGNGPRNALIGLTVSAAAATALLLVFARRRDVQMEAGSTMQIVLPSPLLLDRDSVMAAVQRYGTQVAGSPPQIVQPPKPRNCYDPGSPGTPDTRIPGSPGTPPTVIPGANGMPDTVIPGTPATPDTVIQGTPGTPSSTYPCP